jgi:hypothetical protein
MAEALLLEIGELVLDALVRLDVAGAVEALCDRSHLFPERHIVRIEVLELRLPAIGERDHGPSQIARSLAAMRPVIGDDRLDTLAGAELLQPVELRRSVGAEAIDRDDRRYAELA